PNNTSSRSTLIHQTDRPRSGHGGTRGYPGGRSPNRPDRRHPEGDRPRANRTAAPEMGCLMGTAAPHGLEGYSAFQLRRVLERLREGLDDPLAVRLLTAHRAELDARLRQDLLNVEARAGAHLCVCGPY